MGLSAGFKSFLFPAPFALALLLTGEHPAQAGLTFNIYEESGNTYIETSGSLNLPPPVEPDGAVCDLSVPLGGFTLVPSFGFTACVGNSTASRSNIFRLIPPTPYPFTNPGVPFTDADAASGLPLALFAATPANYNFFLIDPSYINGTPITSSSTFLNKTFGFTTPGPIVTWTIAGTTETIDVVVGKPAPASVPGPLPILGAGAAYSWSRRLRRRTQAKI